MSYVWSLTVAEPNVGRVSGGGGDFRTVNDTEAETGGALPSDTVMVNAYVRSTLCDAGAVQIVSSAYSLANERHPVPRSLSHKSSSLKFPVPRSPSVDDILSIYGVFQSQHPRICPIPDRQARHKLRVGTSETGSPIRGRYPGDGRCSAKLDSRRGARRASTTLLARRGVESTRSGTVDSPARR